MTARIDTAPNALDWVVAVGRSGRVVLEFSDAGDPWTFPGTPVFAVVGLETTITATLATSNRDGAEDDQVVIEWDEDAFEGYGGQLSRMALDADTTISILPIFAGAFRILPEGFPGNPTVGTYEITLGDATVEVDVALAGRSATVAVGDVETLPPSSPATVENVGTAEDAVLDFGIPQGIQGISGVIISDTEPDDTTVLWVDTTEDSPLPVTIEVGSTTTLDAGFSATAVNSGDTVNVVLDFGIPKGDAATVDVGTVATLPAGSDAVVVNSGTVSAAVLDFELPRGPTGIVVSTLAPQDPDEGTVWALPTNGHTAVHAGGQWWPLAPTSDNVAKVLSEAVLWIDADEPGGQAIPNLGTGGSALDAKLGSTTGVDTNDPQFYAHDGTNHVRLPGTAGNQLTVPDSDVFDVEDIEIILRVSLNDWTPAANQALIAKATSTSDTDVQFRLSVLTSGLLECRAANAAGDAAITAASDAPSLTDGTTYWLKVNHRPSTGAVNFYKAADQSSVPSSWTQIGSTVTVSTLTGRLANSAIVQIGQFVTTDALAGRVYRAVVKDGIDGTAVLDVDIPTDLTSGSATSFTATSGQTVTIVRTTTGRRTMAVTHPLWLFDGGDHIEIPDNDLLDVGAADSFTVMLVHRPWDTFTTNAALIAKQGATADSTQGWILRQSSTPTIARFSVGDGTNGAAAFSNARTSGALSVSTGVRNVDADTLTAYLGATAGTPVTDTTTGTSANSAVVRIGRLSSAANYFTGEVFAALLWRRALTAGEITALDAYFTTRMP